MGETAFLQKIHFHFIWMLWKFVFCHNMHVWMQMETVDMSLLFLWGIHLIANIEGALRDVGIDNWQHIYKSNSSVKKYFFYFLKWKGFCKKARYNPLPVEPIHVELYLSELLDSPIDVSCYFNSSKHTNGLTNMSALSDPTANRLVSNMLRPPKGMRSKSSVKKDAITSDILITLYNMFLGILN